MILSLKDAEAAALARELERSTDPAIEPVREKLARALGPRPVDVIPGQTTIDDHLKGEAA